MPPPCLNYGDDPPEGSMMKSVAMSLAWGLRMAVTLTLLVVPGCSGFLAFPTEPEKEALQIAPLSRPGMFLLPEVEARRLCTFLLPERQKMTSWSDMAFAVEQSLLHVRSLPASHRVFRGQDQTVTYGELVQALELLKSLLPRLDTEPELLASCFAWYRIGPDFGFTGYYEPELLVSPVRTTRFRYPLYKKPPELHLSRKCPYYSRYAIDHQGVLAGRGLEIAWAEDPLDVFILQIQGSGRLRYLDGRLCYALYAAQNGHKYVSLGRVMRDRGYLPADHINLDSIRDWIARHPQLRDELLSLNPSYVFFRLSDSPSVGSMGRVLTPWISVASDQEVLPNGCLTFMALDMPEPDGARPFYGLTLPQDRGGAIRQNRVDIFCGSGEKAGHIASHLDTKGAVFLLLPRHMSSHLPQDRAMN